MAAAPHWNNGSKRERQRKREESLNALLCVCVRLCVCGILMYTLREGGRDGENEKQRCVGSQEKDKLSMTPKLGEGSYLSLGNKIE